MGKNERLKERCFWLKGTLCTLELGLGYRTTFFALALHRPLPALSHTSMQHKVRPSQSGLTKMAVIVSNVGQSQNGASASFLDRNVSGLGPPPLSHTASNAMRTHPTTTRTT